MFQLVNLHALLVVDKGVFLLSDRKQ
jgi:hypothetical protein